MGRDVNGGEIGCYFSHIRALENFLETGAPYGFVLEDDMLPNEHA
ncbi:glycosyltransferase family 25 protein, partial [Planktotalea sp.]